MGIIGVVCALTLPAVIQNIQDRQLRVAWRRQFSLLSNAIVNVKSETCYGNLSDCFSTRVEIVDALCNNMNCIQKCTKSEEQGCWHKIGDYSSPNGFNTHSRNDAGFILNDGSYWIMNTIFNKACKPADQWTQTAYEGDCFDLFVDVNGKTKPNVIGRDIFRAVVLKDKIIPYGAPPIGTSSCSTWGDGCSYKYLY